MFRVFLSFFAVSQTDSKSRFPVRKNSRALEHFVLDTPMNPAIFAALNW
jgi:hypothetical protein